jgi:hypothetical protein
MMKRASVFVALTLGTAVLAGACVDDDDGLAPDASTTPDAGSPDAAPPASGVNSNLPGVDWQVDSTSEPGLVIVSSSFTQEDLGGSVFNHWYAELENRGSAIECYAHVKLELQDASGTPLVALESFADARPYQAGSSVSMPCLAPGEHGAFYDINQVDALVETSSIRRGAYRIDTLVRNDAQPSPLAPTVLSASVIPKFNGWAVTGSVRADGGTIYNLGMDVYTIGASGRISDRVSDFHLDTLFAGSTWGYETDANGGEPVVSYLQSIEFIVGASSKRSAVQEPRALARQTFRAERARVRALRDARAE